MMDGLERGSKVSCKHTTKKYPKSWVTRTWLPLSIKTNDSPSDIYDLLLVHQLATTLALRLATRFNAF
jgi:hypothetical protein